MNRYAVVWGIRGTRGDSIAGDNNGRLFARLLSRLYGYDKRNIRALIGNQLSYESAVESLSWVRDSSDDSSTVILFYSGHGGPNSAGLFSQTFLDYLLSDIKYDKLCMIFESCYSGNACEPLSGDNRLIIASTQVGKVGPTTAHDSPFGNYFLRDAIKMGLGDSNQDGKVSMQEAFYYYQMKTNGWGTMSDNCGEFIP